MLLTVKQVAARLNVSLSTIYEEIRIGRLAVFRLGVKRGVIRVSEEALEQFLYSRREESLPLIKTTQEEPLILKHLKL